MIVGKKGVENLNILLIQSGKEMHEQKEIEKANTGRLNMPMLGLLYIAASISSEHNVQVIDEIDGLITVFHKYDIVGISGMTMHANRMYYLADQYRKLGCHVVLGGIHVSFMVEEALLHADTVIVGEGEELWSLFLEDFMKGIQKSVYFTDKLLDLTALPFPDRKLIDSASYQLPKGSLNSVIATRGCPNTCSFCCVRNMFKKTYRVRPVSSVIEEIKTLDNGLVMFQDDNIFGNPKYAKELLLELKNVHRIWSGQCSINVANNKEILDLMEQSGCCSLFIGIESINPKNINEIGKTGVNKPNLYGEEIKKLHDKGISIIGSFIVGLDDDDEKCFDDIYEFCYKNKIDYPAVSCLTPFPGTVLYEQLFRENRIIDFNWDKYTLTNVVIKPKMMSSDVMQYKYNELMNALHKLNTGNRNIVSRTQLISKKMIDKFY